MSNIYIQEPPTDGKVLLKTTVGDIDVELWSKECPKTCRNFIQLCMEGYYDGTIFHRLVKDFIVQGGDPSGTGMGGESVYGEPFKDEIHSRLKFNRRGLLGMANSGAKNDNTSQFFFTLGATPELNGKHTLFGKVAGNTIYNMIKLQETETDRNEKPLHPHKILRTEILYNPFDDILPRETSSSRKRKSDREDDKRDKVTARATKDRKLLSFVDDEEEEAEESFSLRGKSKSSHDIIKDDPVLSSVPVIDPAELQSKRRIEDRESSKERLEEDQEDRVSRKDKKEKRKREDKKFHENHDSDKDEPEDSSKKSKKSKKEETKQLSRLEEARLEYKKLKKEVINDRKKAEAETEAFKSNDPSSSLDEDVVKFLKEKQSYREKSLKIMKKGSSREEQTLAVLSQFRKKLLGEQKSLPKETKEESKDLEEEDLPSSSLKDTWMTHKFTCNKEDEGPVLAKDANLLGEGDWYDIYDPRSKIAQRRANHSGKE